MGASQSQKGANSAPERASPTKLQTGFQFLTKDFLRFWTVDTRREGHSQRSAPQKRRAPGNPEAGTGEVMRAPHLRRVCSPITWSPRPLGPGDRTELRPHRVCAFVQNPSTRMA